ncbi:hypothetical protein HK102_006509, partial [Quaeritorhiza haematococci]
MPYQGDNTPKVKVTAYQSRSATDVYSAPSSSRTSSVRNITSTSSVVEPGTAGTGNNNLDNATTPLTPSGITSLLRASPSTTSTFSDGAVETVRRLRSKLKARDAELAELEQQLALERERNRQERERRLKEQQRIVTARINCLSTWNNKIQEQERKIRQWERESQLRIMLRQNEMEMDRERTFEFENGRLSVPMEKRKRR